MLLNLDRVGFHHHPKNNLEILYHIIEALKNSNGVVAEAPNTEEKNLLKGSILYEGDLLSPIDEAWEAEL